MKPGSLVNPLLQGGDLLPFLAPLGVLGGSSVELIGLKGVSGAVLVINGFVVESEYPKGVDIVTRLGGTEIGRFYAAPGASFAGTVPLTKLTEQPQDSRPADANLSIAAATKPATTPLGLVFGQIRIELPEGEKEVFGRTVRLPATECRQDGSTRRCAFDMPEGGGSLQLPALYYDGLLKVRVGGRDTRYYGTVWGGNVLTTIDLPPGRHDVTMRFTGLDWANKVSLVSWMLLLAALAIGLVNLAWRTTSHRPGLASLLGRRA